MKTIWLINMDDEVDNNNLSLNDLKTLKNYIELVNDRHLLVMGPDDIILLPYKINEDFVEYCQKLIGINRENIFENLDIMKLESTSLVDSILNNETILNKLKNICINEKCILQPYVQTSKCVLLANSIGADWIGSNPKIIDSGLIRKINSKAFIRDFAASNNINLSPCIIVNKKNDLIEAINDTAIKNKNIFLKKDGFTGGMGNLGGSKDFLLSKIDDWYEGGRVLVEPFLNIEASVGAQILIENSEVNFIGVNLQLFEKLKWCGFEFPYLNDALVLEIRKRSISLATEFSRMGLCGWLNLDWCILTEGNDKLLANRVILNECNFRYTAFYRLYKFYSSILDKLTDPLLIQAVDEVPCKKDESFKHFLMKLNNQNNSQEAPDVSLEMIKASGVLITRPPLNGSCGLAFFAESKSKLEFLKEQTILRLQ